MLRELVMIGAGGFLGSIFRYQISAIFSKWNIYAVPIGTYIINVLGSLVLGMITGANSLTEDQMKFLSVGFLGAFTTFSTFNFELLQLKENKKNVHFFVYAAFMYISNFLAAFLGFWWGKN